MRQFGRRPKPSLWSILAMAVALPLAFMTPAWGSSDGTGYSWGGNANSRLGNGSTTSGPAGDQLFPYEIAPPNKFISLTAGDNGGCGVDIHESAWCWGSGFFGQLGNGTYLDASTPQQVAPPADASIPLRFYSGLLDRGRLGTCGITSPPYDAYCWGLNTVGLLGNDSTMTSSSIPVQVVEPTPMIFKSIGVGSNSACAVADHDATVPDFYGAVYCWGSNASGELGNPTTTEANVPVPVMGFTNTQIIERVNAVYVMGSNVYAGTNSGLYISTDGSSTFSLKDTDDGLGGNVVSGVYALGSTIYAATGSSPCFVGGLSIATNGDATFTNKTTDNGLGSNCANGVYAVGSTVYAATGINGSPGGLAISTDGGTSFSNDATTSGLGSSNVNGVYSVGSTVYAATEPGIGSSDTGGLSISTDGGSTFINKRTTDGLGSDFVNGVYAVGSTVYAATGVIGNAGGGLSISTDGGSTFINKRTTDGLGSNFVNGVYAVGSTVYAATAGGLSVSTDGGQTFTNYTMASGLPSNDVRSVYASGAKVYVGTLAGLSILEPKDGFLQVSAGESFACGVTRSSNGALSGPGWCWGRNDRGQLGKGNVAVTSENNVPQSILGGLTLAAISAGNEHACALTNAGAVYCWGSNDRGQVGIGSLDATVTTPTQVNFPGGAIARDVSAGYSNSCAITDAATYCWGENSHGQIGDGTRYTDATVPTAVTGFTASDSPVQVLSAEQYTSALVKPRMLFLSGMAFSSIQVDQSTSTTVSVKNNLPWNASITGTSVSGSGVAITGSTCTGTLSASASCNVNLSWSPSTAGALNGSLTISYNGISSTTTLTGTATALPVPAPGPQPSSSTSTAAVSPPAEAPVASTPTSASMTSQPVRGPIATVSGAGVASTPPIRASSPPAPTLADAPMVRTEVGDVIRVGVGGLPADERVVVFIRIRGTWTKLGTTVTGPRGRATLPAFTSARAGEFPLRLRVKGSPATYVRVDVRPATG